MGTETEEDASRATRRRSQGIRGVTVIGGAAFLLFGLWAFLGPQSFFDNLATFEPYNVHLIRDIGAFQIGLGAVLLLVAFLPDPHGGALLGVGIGGVFHSIAHVIDRDLGGSPATDIPTFAIIAALLLWAGVAQLRA
ncbi:MAG: hypothetical protein KY461_10640 [Actinobacteria bacterium]|nr:hypothetical protein [Actinomycetota bacterium]